MAASRELHRRADVQHSRVGLSDDVESFHAVVSVNRARAPVASSFFIQHRDVRQIAILLGVVEPVANHEPILDREADVLDRDVDLPSRRLAEQTRRPQRLRRPGPQDILQVDQRQPGIDDVLDDDDVAALRDRESRSFSIRTSPDDLVLFA